MQLKRMEAYGFKSFADKISIEFDAGITAIVGPNGSGKSNITDAIRWVLGEQNVRNLRGTKAEDIIFTGSAARHALGVAEVSLFFDNDGTLPVDFREVVVTRRLYRSGESEFYINKSRCRLKDIYNLFADTGIGHDGMSIIGQNRIDDILNSKPEERRAFFEETAGITKYRNRKRESMRRLLDTENNLVRVQDIIQEIETQLGPLKRHAEKTRIYNELHEEFQQCQLTQLARDYQRESLRKQETAVQMREKQDASQALETKVHAAMARKEELGQKAIELEQQMQQQAAGTEGIRQQIEAASREAAMLTERQEQGTAAQERLLGSREALRATLTESVAEIARLAMAAQQKKREHEQAEALLQEAREEARRCEDSLARVRQQSEQAQADTRRMQSQLAGSQQELALLQRMQSAYEGFGKAPRAVLRATAPWRKNIAGAVAELIDVPTDYITAIEVALGAGQQNIVTEDTTTAKEAIAFLKREHLGRVTFLPLSTLVVRRPPDIRLTGERGAIGWASELVKIDPRYQKALDFLLSRTLVVDTLDNALALAKRHEQKLRIVTLTGELLNPGGSLSGGGRGRQDAGYLNRSAEIDALASRVKQQEKQLEDLRSTERRIQQEQLEWQRTAQELTRKRQEQELKHAVLGQEYLRASERLERQREDKARDEAALTANEQEEKELLASLESSKTRLAELEKQQDALEEKLYDSQQAHDGLYKKRMELLAEGQQADKDAHAASRQVNDLQGEIHKLEITAAKIELMLTDWQDKILQEYGLTPERAAEEALDIEAADLKQRLSELSAKIRELGPVNPNALEQYEELSGRHDFMQKQANDLIEAKENLEKILLDMDEAMTKQFNEAFAKIQVYFSDIFVRLFGGGQAELQLTDRENVLNSGVDILVTLPQKKRQNLSALSGGERALTVIALLFSFLRYRPSPFSVLDEIDAPLDEANVVRFGQFLKEFSTGTQFIIVTHRKGTMESVDTMYGVTIEDAGVSRILSVKLDDIA